MCVLGLEALGPFVRAFSLNTGNLMLQVGLDGAPLWHCANGVCEDTGVSLLHFPYLHLLSFPSPSSLSLSPSPLFLSLHWLTHKDPLLLFFCPVQPVHEVQRSSEQPKTHLNYSSARQTVQFFSLPLSFFMKCATTGLSIDWNKNNQTARADQQSRPFENSTEKPGK